MTNDTEQNKEKLLVALEKSLGIVTHACKAVGLSRTCFYHYVNTDEEFKNKVNDILELQIDFVESKLLERIKEGSDSLIKFYMQYRGQRRGYTNTIELTGNQLNKIQVEIVNPRKEEDE